MVNRLPPINHGNLSRSVSDPDSVMDFEIIQRTQPTPVQPPYHQLTVQQTLSSSQLRLADMQQYLELIEASGLLNSLPPSVRCS